MPLALLLQETVYTFRWGASHLEPWSHLVRVEALLIDRARGAFLTHWFGPHLPLDGFFVRVVIANLPELRAQYLTAARSLLPDVDGPNLVEPLAGIAGMLAGIAVSPTMVLLGVIAISRRIGPLIRQFGWKMLLLPLAQVAVAGIAAPLIPVAILGSLWLVSAQPDRIRQIYLVLGSVASLLIAGTGFLKQFTGPREAIANPLLKAILEMFDRLAGLLPFVLAFVSIMISRVAPLIEPLASQVAPFAALIAEVFDTVGFIFGDIQKAFVRFWPMIADQMDFVLVQLSLIAPVFGIIFTELFTNLSEQIGTIVDEASKAIEKWLIKTLKSAANALNSRPTGLLFRSAAVSFDIASKWLGSEPSSPSSSSIVPADFPKFEPTRPSNFIHAMGNPPRGSLDAIETLAGIDLRHHGALFGDDVTFSAKAREGIAAALRPTQVFQSERGVLARKLGEPSPEQALAKLRATQLGLRDAVRDVVGRLLPAALRVEVHTLDGYFDKLDQWLYQAKIEKHPDFPLQDLADNGKLRAIVHRLVIRGTDVKRSDADTFQARLQELLTKQTYPAEAPSGLALVRS